MIRKVLNKEETTLSYLLHRIIFPKSCPQLNCLVPRLFDSSPKKMSPPLIAGDLTSSAGTDIMIAEFGSFDFGPGSRFDTPWFPFGATQNWNLELRADYYLSSSGLRLFLISSNRKNLCKSLCRRSPLMPLPLSFFSPQVVSGMIPSTFRVTSHL